MKARSVIVDVEATCSRDEAVPRQEMEIIEVGAVTLDNERGEVISEYQTFVRPVRNPVLTDFCRELTSITQAQVDEAPGYAEAMGPFAEWLEEQGDYDFCSWGFYDRKQFERDCAFHEVPYPFSGPHRNVKMEVSKILRVKGQYGLGGALKHLGLEFEGTAHRGIDDARNIARVVCEVLL